MITTQYIPIKKHTLSREKSAGHALLTLVQREIDYSTRVPQGFFIEYISFSYNIKK